MSYDNKIPINYRKIGDNILTALLVAGSILKNCWFYLGWKSWLEILLVLSMKMYFVAVVVFAVVTILPGDYGNVIIQGDIDYCVNVILPSCLPPKKLYRQFMQW